MPKKTKEELIALCKKVAEAHYHRGYDVFVECYDDAEWDRLYADCNGNENRMFQLMGRVASVYRERRADAINSAF